MVNDNVKVTAAPSFQLSPSASGPRPTQIQQEPQDVFVNSNGLLVCIPHVNTVSQFDSWSFYV